ncbi:MAG: hypothetical protein CMJ89_06430 [Planctomycetes bacterium]|jgi:paraquat-inducible protein B|nr:hypothetical protein [Planctomycetota bacterium]
MTQDVHYFRVGLFVLGTVALSFAAVIWMGATSVFERSALVETCFDESVQGLDIGAPVKFRGIEIGSVVAIESADDIYKSELSEKELEEFGRYIVVTMRITASQFFEEETSRLKQKRIDAAVERGYRMRLNLLGLSGQVFINADFVDPALWPLLELSWRPRYSYVPSAPSSLPRIVESAGNFFSSLESSELVYNLDRLLATLEERLRASDIPGLISAASDAAESFTQTSTDLNRLLGNPALQEVPGEIAAASAAMRNLTVEFERDFPLLLDNLRAVALRMQEFVESEHLRGIVVNTEALSSDLHLLAQDLPPVLDDLQRVLRRVDRLVAGAEGSSEGILQDLRRMVRHLGRLTSDLRGNPSQSIFGDPPAPRR